MSFVRETLRSDRGSTLVVVCIFALVMLISALALVELGAQDAALAMRDVKASQAFYNAEAGAQRGEAWLLGQTTVPSSTIHPFGDDPESFGGGLVLVAITPSVVGSRTVYSVQSYSSVDNRSRAIQVDLTPTAFTDYLYYTNQDVGPGSPGYFRTGDVVDGPIHLNDLLAVWGDPVFEAEVHTTANEIIYQNDWNPITSAALSNAPFDNPSFEQGIELGCADLPWLSESDLNVLKALAGLSLSNVDIIFGRDAGSGPMLGYLSYSKINQGIWTDVDISSFNGLVYVNGSCTVSGIIDGQVSVVNNATIDIVDNLLYAGSSGGVPLPDCDDILGLVASTRVGIVDNVPNGTDITIHAHMMSMNNMASLVENYSQGSPRGTLTIHGGLAQDKWGPVGTGYYDYDGTFHVLTGYERDFHYDWRLRTLLPPGYDSIIFKGGALDRLVWREITPIDLYSL